MRLELTRSCDHYPLKVACIPISPPAPAFSYRTLAVPRTGLEPARLATYAPETYASTNSATWARRNSLATRFVVCTTKMSPRLLLFEKPLFAQCFFEGLQRTLPMNFVPLEKVSRTSVLLISLGERQTRLELATPTLARSCSTN